MSEELAKEAMRIACEVVREYGEGGEHEHMAAVGGELWRDHPAFVAALRGMRHHQAADERQARIVKMISHIAGGLPASEGYAYQSLMLVLSAIDRNEHLKAPE